MDAGTHLRDALRAAGTSLDLLRKRVFLVICGLFACLAFGAVMRSVGLQEFNYFLIVVFGLGALYAFLHPAHIVSMLLVSGGIVLTDSARAAGLTLATYGRFLGRILLAVLIPLLLFARGGGDTSLGPSLSLLLLTPVVVLAMWVFGQFTPIVERAIFFLLPTGALLLSIANILVPQTFLAAIGIPAWLRAERPQDRELAEIEVLIQTQKNVADAANLRRIREKIESEQPLTLDERAELQFFDDQQRAVRSFIQSEATTSFKLQDGLPNQNIRLAITPGRYTCKAEMTASNHLDLTVTIGGIGVALATTAYVNQKPCNGEAEVTFGPDGTAILHFNLDSDAKAQVRGVSRGIRIVFTPA